MGGALGKGGVLDARTFLITLAPAGPASAPAMFAPELELLLLLLSLSFLMKEGLKLPIRANEDFLKKKNITVIGSNSFGKIFVLNPRTSGDGRVKSNIKYP